MQKFIVIAILLTACNFENEKSTSSHNLYKELSRESENKNPTQHFVISPGSDTLIIGSQGTEIQIIANSFKFEDGGDVIEPIEFKLKEIYEKSEAVEIFVAFTGSN